MLLELFELSQRQDEIYPDKAHFYTQQEYPYAGAEWFLPSITALMTLTVAVSDFFESSAATTTFVSMTAQIIMPFAFFPLGQLQFRR